ncbi:IclR family transcriptional regulator [Salininema proteolyticum]|uniref:IclR family transcriptional regulator n=1 Tax=Salininema proteolyticum TaxID=1607685 RepID=A0ABV8TX67_9ACTN
MGDSKKQGSGGTIQSVQRALRILEYIGRHPEGVTAPRIAHQFQLNRATAYNLLRTLVQERYAVHADNGRFILGTQVSQRYSDLVRVMQNALVSHSEAAGLPKQSPRSGKEVMRQRADAVSVESYITRIVAETGYSIFVASMIDSRVTLLDVIEGRRSPHVEDLVVGFDEGAHATAFGKALLSTLPTQKRANYLGEYGMRPFTRNTLTDFNHFDYDLDQAARKGVYLEMEQYRPDIACAAVLVPDAGQGQIPLSLATAVPTEHMGQWGNLITNRLRRAAREISTIRSF